MTLGGLQQLPDRSREMPFEAAQCFKPALAISQSGGEVLGGRAGRASLDDGDAVQRALSCRLPPRSRRWRCLRPEETGTGATLAWRAKLASF